MLSKLMSNIANKDVEGLAEDKGGMEASEKAFKSLLESLQGGGSSGKQPLLDLTESDENSDSGGKGSKLDILGGNFIEVGSDGESVDDDSAKAIQSLLERLQQLHKAEADGEGAENKLMGDEIADDESSESDEDSADSKRALDSSSADGKGKFTVQEGSDNESAGSEKINPGSESIQAGELKTDKGEENSGKDKNAENKEADQTKKAEPKTGPLSEQNDRTENKDGPMVQQLSSDGEETKTEDQDKKQAQAENKENNKVTRPAGSIQSESRQTSQQTVEVQEAEELQKGDSRGSEEKPSETDDKVETKSTKGEHDSHIRNTDQQINQSGKKAASRSGSQREFTNPQNNSEQNGINRELSGMQGAKSELTDQQKKVVDSFFQQNTSAGISEKGMEMKSAQAEKGKKKSKESTDRGNGGMGSRLGKSRDELLSRLGISNRETQKQAPPLDLQNFSGISTGSSETKNEQQEIMWEKKAAGTTVEKGEDKETMANNSSSVRLGQMPVTNASLRKNIIPGLTQSIRQAASEAQKNPDNWKKHNFVLDDGKKIQLSVRESKGVLQVKMGSMNGDLSKLLQQNMQQIREHLKQEFGSSIDLQFEGHEEGNESQFTGDTQTSDRRRNYRNSFSNTGTGTETVEAESTRKVRDFGYNRMEWTA